MTIKRRLIKSMNEWDSERIKEELISYILRETDDNIEKYYFDDIATEEEHEKGKLIR